MSIVTLATFKTFDRNLTTVDDTLAQYALDAADSWIFEYCQRKIVVASSASDRTYTPDGSDLLRIHDCTTVVSVTYDGTTVASTEYQKEPTAVSWSGETRPYEQLRRIASSWPRAYGEAVVTVNATWGWAAIPSAVTQAALIVAKDIFDTREVRFGVGNVSEFGPTAVRVNKAAASLLAPYRRVESFGLA